MNMARASKSTTTEETQTERRYVRETGAGLVPFYPWGLIPAVGLALVTLFALFPFASGWIERQTETAARTTLEAAGEDWVTVDASGQWVTLRGTPPSAWRAARAELLVRDAKAQTPFGLARPVTRIRTAFAATQEVVSLDPVDPDSAFDPLPIEPRGSSTEPTPPSADEGTTPSTAPSPSEETPASQDPELAACNNTLARLLSQTRFNFASNSSDMAETDNALLDEIAEISVGCRGTLIISGHTDSTGAADANRILSLARASAVRDALILRGLSSDRIEAQGFGEARPLADNDTVEGRARNRRIDIRLKRQTGQN